MPDATHRHWLRAPARPIWYSPVQRFEDWRNGRRDGKKGFPRVAPRGNALAGAAPGSTQAAAADPTPPDDTFPGPAADHPAGDASVNADARIDRNPYIAQLSRAAAGAIRGESLRREQRLCPLLRRLAEAEIAHGSSGRVLERAEERFKAADVPDADPSLSVRRIVEDQRSHPSYLSHNRRRTERSRAVAASEGARSQAQSLADAATADLEKLKEQIASEKRAAAARAHRINEHCRRRIASYCRHLTRHHPDGHDVISVLEPAGPDLPAWACEPPQIEEERE